MLINRYLTGNILKDLSEKMVFLGGARQVGKTTLARKLVAPSFQNPFYFNWDNRTDRKKIIQGELPGNCDFIIFDEIHKYKKWKNFVKGKYDVYSDTIRFLITGSARFNIYRKGGDSLLGRYHYYTLHPFSLAEILMIKNTISISEELFFPSNNNNNDFNTLERFGGFPEIFIKQDERTLRRWHNERIERLFREDIRDLESVRDISSMQLLSDLLPERVGSPLSINSLREDLEVSHRAVTNWLNILELFYYHFRIYPYHKKQIRSIKKEPKLYLFDWSEVQDESARFENMLASHLLKLVHYLYEYEGYNVKLNYLRNVDKKEVDFFVTADGKPWFCVEAKLQDTSISPSIFYFRDRLNIPYCYQVVKKPFIDIIKNGVRIISADRFCAGLL